MKYYVWIYEITGQGSGETYRSAMKEFRSLDELREYFKENAHEIFRVQKIFKGEDIEFSLGVKDEN